MKLISGILDRPWIYRAWQAPFADRKLARVLACNDLATVRRVLDVGCGPGTNTRYFANSEYLGVDLNESYVEHARQLHGNKFEVADITSWSVATKKPFDFILVNSVLHHLDTEVVRRILQQLRTLLTDDGHVHILELVRPSRPGVARLLSAWDRGEYPRPLEEWRRLFGELYEPVVFQPYPLRVFGVALWNMVYFKGRGRRA